MRLTPVSRRTGPVDAHAGGAVDRRERFWEIDSARALAIAMMVAYHVAYDVELLAPGLGPDPFTGWWGALPEATGSLFLFVAGVSLAVADARMRARGLSRRQRLARHLRRAGVVMAAAVVVSIATYVAFGDRLVRFGILHAISVGTVVVSITVTLGAWNLALGLAALGASVLLAGVDGPIWLLPVGLGPSTVSSVDYWPLLPWIGPMLIGAWLAGRTYPDGKRCDPLTRFVAACPRPPVLPSVGRRSLAIYLVHQPVLIPVVWFVLLLAGAEVPWPV